MIMSLTGSNVAGTGTGAGYGAPGGSKDENTAGGSWYGLTRDVVDMGSGGGNSTGGVGGAGGAYLHLGIFGALTLEGTIRLNGAAGTGTNAGGGSGGGAKIDAFSMTGHGLLEANGGKGTGNGGGGAGGRVEIVLKQG